NPTAADISERLPALLEVLYLIFNEGYSATAGDDLLRPALCEDAMRLGRILAQLTPQQAEVHGLLALMEIQASRLGARTGPDGELILLKDQNRARWNHLLIQHGLMALEKAKQTGTSPGPYVLQAEIAACHARAKTAQATDWQRITALYEILIRVLPSPVVMLNHAVAVAMAFGPSAGLERVDALRDEDALKDYYLLASTRGDFLFKLKRFDEAGQEFQRAARLTQNNAEQQFLLHRLKECRIADAG
ncbi:MAG TPA: DUF6596 domain-containing protein, partial [Gammaproteobacteria bacterium]|nr:DUF6596 domain-containing protein [Gammaproteobacteria bacterium]